MKKGLVLLKFYSIALSLCLLTQMGYASDIGTFREPDSQKDDSQLGSGHQNSVSYRGEWAIYVKGHTTVATGVGNVPYQFIFSHPRTGKSYRSTLFTGAFPMTDETEQFYQNYAATVEYMTDYLGELFNDQVNFVSHDNIIQPVGGNVYVFYFELWNQNYTEIYPITIAYRFDQSYYIFAMGTNLGDLPELFKITKCTAADFIDYSNEPMSGFLSTSFTGTYRHTLSEWKYDVINPFQILMEQYDE